MHFSHACMTHPGIFIVGSAGTLSSRALRSRLTLSARRDLKINESFTPNSRTRPQHVCGRGRLSVHVKHGVEKTESPRIVGMGGIGVDYLASVAAYPEANDKLRTQQLEVQGGGNCGNALTATARLGLQPVIISKVGNDAMGDTIVQGLEDEGIDATHVLRGEGASPFTYIIVDQEGGTRTCIHTPGPALDPKEITDPLLQDALDGAALVYFDGRLTEAALLVAEAASTAGVPILVEAERLRPNLEKLLPYADYVITSETFPSSWTGEELVGNALLEMASRLPDVKFIVTTLGSEGSLLFEWKEPDDEAAAKTAVPVEEVIRRLKHNANSGADDTATVHSSGMLNLASSGEGCAQAARAKAMEAAQAAAISNADSGNAGRYMASADPGTFAILDEDRRQFFGEILFCSSWPTEVIDTTGAGDAFIGTMCYSLCTGLSREKSLMLSSFVAATKCRQLGPRPGLPYIADVPASLLN